ncbi:hypothetical protein [Methylovulum miyakonense]|uniref:hypothetical protein n=1 Tax=Methylovulum miyakonense TaxID=645578 RepID=UPI0003696242|nr:hypothetical protein [Methylovulum miyakonense]
MGSFYTIKIKNESFLNQNFVIFQQPAVYVGGWQVYVNAVFDGSLRPFYSDGGLLIFQCLQHCYAGAQVAVPSLQPGQSTGYMTAGQAIDVTPQSGVSNNSTNLNLSINPLGLDSPTHAEGVREGAYRIVTPSFDPISSPINVGLAIKHPASDSYILSSFIQAQPLSNIDCQPIAKFYITTGNDYQAGQLINPESLEKLLESAAICDATQGSDTFDVTYNPDGSWTVLYDRSVPSGGGGL